MFFTISSENLIAKYDTYEQAIAAAPAEEIFQTSKEFTHIVLEWPIARFVDVWNKLPGTTPVRKFENRQKAGVRIWKAINGDTSNGGGEKYAQPRSEAEKAVDVLLAEDAESAAAPQVQAKAASAANTSKQPKAKKEPKAPKAPKEPKAKKEREPKAEGSAPREGTAKAKVIGMLGRANGVTLDSIVNETGWQKHTVRGFISILGSKHGMKIDSSKRESDGARVYKLAE